MHHRADPRLRHPAERSRGDQVGLKGRQRVRRRHPRFDRVVGRAVSDRLQPPAVVVAVAQRRHDQRFVMRDGVGRDGPDAFRRVFDGDVSPQRFASRRRQQVSGSDDIARHRRRYHNCVKRKSCWRAQECLR
jgi:hypothetical protein